MCLPKKIIFIVIFLILFYILFRLVQKRTQILRIMNKEDSVMEGLSCESDIKDPLVKKIMDANFIGQITDNLSSKGYYNGSDTLNKFHIKSSYNSAYNGKGVTKDMVLYVLHRGYRFLDFEVSYDMVSGGDTNNKKAVVSFNSTANTNVALQDILDVININAFSNVSNKDDPLFIQIRPAYKLSTSTDTDEKNNYKKIGENTQLNTQIESALSIFTSYKHNGKISGETPMNILSKKIIIVMDNMSNQYSNNKTQRLIDMINISPSDMTLCNAGSTLENCNKKDNNKTNLVEVVPMDSNNQPLTQNPESLSVLSKTECNICPMMAWMSSYIGGYKSAGFSQLGEYEIMFNKVGGSAFIMLSEAKQYAIFNDPSKLNSNAITV